ncbi:MAG: hypothetical protein RIQ60_2555 [Pseudomonadota bacterium]|jgi:clan AA aspartic protease (TIGR02281 family)
MRDLPPWLKITTVWLLLGTVVFLAVSWLQADRQRARFNASGGVIELQRAPDGHFHWPGQVNGIAVDFLVDTGATRTTLPRSLADAARLERLGSLRSDTAGGTVTGELARADLRLEGGVQLDQWQVAVLPRLSSPLLGMDVLGRTRFNQDGGRLRIEAAGNDHLRPAPLQRQAGAVGPGSLGLAALGSAWRAGTTATGAPQLALAPASSAAPCSPLPTPPSRADLLEAVRSATDRGFLWRLEQGGHTSYLYGSVHVGKLAWLFPGPRTQAALNSADTLALELDPTDPAVAQAAQDMGRPAPAGTQPPSAAQPQPGAPAQPHAQAQADAQQVQSTNLHRTERLLTLLRRECLHDGPLAQAPSLTQAYALVSLAGRPDGLEAAYGQEIALATQARQRHLPVVALESIETQLAALTPQDPADIPAMVDAVLDQLENGVARQVLRRLADSWEAGRLDELANYAAWCECANTPEERAQLVRLNDDRNPGLAAGITRLHRDQGNRVFAAVGALHMTGPAALPLLLQRQGFVVTRVLSP